MVYVRSLIAWNKMNWIYNDYDVLFDSAFYIRQLESAGRNRSAVHVCIISGITDPVTCDPERRTGMEILPRCRMGSPAPDGWRTDRSVVMVTRVRGAWHSTQSQVIRDHGDTSTTIVEIKWRLSISHLYKIKVMCISTASLQLTARSRSSICQPHLYSWQLDQGHLYITLISTADS